MPSWHSAYLVKHRDNFTFTTMQQYQDLKLNHFKIHHWMNGGQ
jgi:hypothetical protein